MRLRALVPSTLGTAVDDQIQHRERCFVKVRRLVLDHPGDHDAQGPNADLRTAFLLFDDCRDHLVRSADRSRFLGFLTGELCVESETCGRNKRSNRAKRRIRSGEKLTDLGATFRSGSHHPSLLAQEPTPLSSVVSPRRYSRFHRDLSQPQILGALEFMRVV